ncbi:MAG: CapA family protein [Alphaproteobacteria bacterium]|nr:CapA family protein [Alphaproteobacteria bacterium]
MTRPIRLIFLGDLMLDRTVSEKLARHSPEWFWGDVLPILQEADGVLANLESPITTSDHPWDRTWKMFHFKADPRAVQILQRGNVRFVCLANNHALDFREAGLLDTLGALDSAGINHAGASRTAIEAAAISVFEIAGLKIGSIAATDTMKPFAAGPGKPGTNFTEIVADRNNLAWIERSVREMRQAHVDLIMLSLHWGPNLRQSPNADFRWFAHAAIERGVDVIHGHSAHVVQAVERYKTGLIMYGTGNALDD